MCEREGRNTCSERERKLGLHYCDFLCSLYPHIIIHNNYVGEEKRREGGRLRGGGGRDSSIYRGYGV